MIAYSFKDVDKSHQYWVLHPKVRDVFEVICKILNFNGFQVEITSMVRPPDTIQGESGVHATGRAIDLIPKGQPISESFMRDIESAINLSFPRKDKKNTCLWHSVPGGGGFHFHLQVAYDQSYTDLKGFVVNLDASEDVPS